MTTLKEQPNEIQQKIYKLGYLDGKTRQFGKNADWANARRGEPNKESHPTYWKGYDFGSDGNVEVDYETFRKNWQKKKNKGLSWDLKDFKLRECNDREKNMRYTKKQLKQIIKEEANKYLDEVGAFLEIIEEGPAANEMIQKLLAALGAVPTDKQVGLFTKLANTVEKYAVASSGEPNTVQAIAEVLPGDVEIPPTGALPGFPTDMAPTMTEDDERKWARMMATDRTYKLQREEDIDEVKNPEPKWTVAGDDPELHWTGLPKPGSPEAIRTQNYGLKPGQVTHETDTVYYDEHNLNTVVQSDAKAYAARMSAPGLRHRVDQLQKIHGGNSSSTINYVLELWNVKRSGW